MQLINTEFYQHCHALACRDSQEGVLRVAVCVYLAAMLFGFTNAATVQPAVATERTVFYRSGRLLLPPNPASVHPAH